MPFTSPMFKTGAAGEQAHSEEHLLAQALMTDRRGHLEGSDLRTSHSLLSAD